MKRKSLWLVCLLALLPCVAEGQKVLEPRRVRNRKVAYAPASRVKTFPFPVVNFVRGGLAEPSDEKEIMDGIIYPLVNRSPKPIAAFVVTFAPDDPTLGVLVIWHDTSFKEMTVERTGRGRIPSDAYKIFLMDDTDEP